MVCRLWHKYANDSSLWRIIDLRPYTISLRNMKKIVNRRVSECTNELRIKGLVTATKKLENLSSPLLEAIKNKASRLQSLFLINCYLNNVGIQSLPGCITKLSLAESLVPLGWFELLKQKNVFPSLEQLDLTLCSRVSSVDISSISNLKTLKTLTLRGCYRIVDDDVRTISTNLKSLITLNLSECKKITDLSLHHIARHIKQIESLSIAHDYQITPLGMSVLNDLAKLVFLNCEGCSLETQHKAIEMFAHKVELKSRICSTAP